MDSQHKEFRIGVMVLAALISLVFLTIYFGKQSIMSFGDEYTIRVRFQRTPGINKNSPVFKNGVQIGRVSNVQLVDEDREVEISILLPKDRKIYTNEECRVRQTVIMGDASLEFVKMSHFTGKVEVIDPDKPLVGGAPADLLSGFSTIEGDLTKAISNVSDAASQMGEFVQRINSLIGSPEELKNRQVRLESMVGEFRTTMNSVYQLTDSANKFMSDPKIQQDVRTVIENMPDILQRSRNLVIEANQFVHDGRSLLERGNTSLDKIDGSLDKAGRALDGITKITDKVQDDVPEFMDNLKKSADKLQSFLDELTSIVQAVNNADGTVKKLMRDPEIYEKLLETVDNVEQISAEVNRMLRADVKPITNNVKIITDKVARDPSIFIRNLIRKQPPVKNSLPVWGDGLGSDTLGDASNDLELFSRERVFFECDNPVYETAPGCVIPMDELPSGEPVLAPETGEIHSVRPSFKDRIGAIFSKNSANRTNELRPVVAASRKLVEEDPIPEEGRIVNVDPRYTTVADHSTGEKPVYRQMSYVEEEEPRLVFTRQ